jgi:glycosyltransferase involved in cell wall biosynthesis
MRIGFHCWEFPPTIVGGLGTYAQCITEALAARGHTLRVWAPEQTEWRASVPPVDAPNVGVERVPLFDATPALSRVIQEDLRGWGRFFSDLLTFNLAAAGATLRAPDLDVVAIQDWLSGMAGMILAQSGARPVVFHVHSTEWGRQPGAGPNVVHHFEGAMAHAADAIITVSQAMKDDLAAHGWDESKIFAVWNGVDPERYRPNAVPPDRVAELRRRYGIDDAAPMLLFVGRLTGVKGVTALIKAMPAILRAEPRARLVVLGVGEQEESLTSWVRELGLQGKVSLRFEFVPEAERITHYAACDLAVFPSTYEPFGIVCLEAMAMGKPLVVGAQGVVGFREQVLIRGEGQNGLHVNGGDASDIAWGVSEALRDRERLRAWGRAGRRRVLDQFTWARAAAKTEAVYEQVRQRFAGAGTRTAGTDRLAAPIQAAFRSY